VPHAPTKCCVLAHTAAPMGWTVRLVVKDVMFLMRAGQLATKMVAYAIARKTAKSIARIPTAIMTVTV